MRRIESTLLDVVIPGLREEAHPGMTLHFEGRRSGAAS
jgi:hypothetical protein